MDAQHFSKIYVKDKWGTPILWFDHLDMTLNDHQQSIPVQSEAAADRLARRNSDD